MKFISFWRCSLNLLACHRHTIALPPPTTFPISSKFPSFYLCKNIQKIFSSSWLLLFLKKMKIACNHSPRHDKNEEEKRDELLTRELDAFLWWWNIQHEMGVIGNDRKLSQIHLRLVFALFFCCAKLFFPTTLKQDPKRAEQRRKIYDDGSFFIWRLTV